MSRDDERRPDEEEEELQELLEEVRRIEAQSRRLVRLLLEGGYRSIFRGSGIEFKEVREYAEGDDLRTVDWNVTARVGRPFVKKYLEERELSVLFLLDLSASMSGGLGVWSARQTAARVCACFALSAMRCNDKVGLVAFSRGVDKFVPPKKGFGHVLRIVRDSLAVRGSGGGSDIVPALEFASSVLRRRSILFLVSDFLADGWKDALSLCARRHDVIAVRLLTPDLAAPEIARGLTRLSDPETLRETVVDWSSPRVRAAYGERVAAWRERTERDIRRAKVDRLDVPVPRKPDKDAIVRPILDFFRMRELRGEKR